MDYITLILSKLEDKSKYITIMDDLMVHSLKSTHWQLLEQLFQSMIKNRLKLSPRKCQLFQTKLVYMGNEFVIHKDIWYYSDPIKVQNRGYSEGSYAQNGETV